MKKKAVLFFMTLVLAASVGGVQARHYASQQARFVSPDPITITKERMTDPQQFNLYSYARNNPLIYIDPSGMDITVTGSATDKDEYKKRLQGSIQSFQIDLDSNGKVGVVGTVDATKLKGTDKKLYEEITNQDKHVGIALTRNDPDVDFGRFEGGGKQTIDLADIAVLDGPNNKGGLSGNNVVAHETYEPYSGLLNNYAVSAVVKAHQSINSFFPGFSVTNPRIECAIGKQSNLVEYQIRHAFIDGGPLKNTNVDIYYKVANPIPFSQNLALQPGHISNVRVIP